MTTDPERVPAAPVYTITLTTAGAYVDGEPVNVPAGDVNAARRAALTEIHVKAAFHGRPVRVIAKEADGTAWPMIVDTDGNVTTLSGPHPQPPAAAPPFAYAPQPAPPDAHALHPPAGHAPQVHAPQPPAPVAHAPQPTAPPAPPIAAPITAPQPAAEPAPAPQPAQDWTAPLPPAYQATYGQLRAAEGAGDLPAAVVLANKLEMELTAEFGPLHPYTVNVLTTRAVLTLRQRTDWYDTVELLIQTALRRRDAGAQPPKDTANAVHNAHAAWRALAGEDPDGAMELCEPLVTMLGHFGEEKRTRDILHWVEETRMGKRKAG